MPVFLLGSALTARVAHADPNSPTDSDKAAARPFAVEGLRLVQAGDCRQAIDKLERGEALVHAPTTAVPLAQCDIQLGKIIAGTEILNRVVNETIPPNAPPSWAEAKQQARGILDAAQSRIAKLRIHVDVPPGVQPNPEVTVDGQPVSAVLLDNDRPTDPGPHHVAARQAGVGSAEMDVTLAEGQVRPVSLRLGGAGPVAIGAAPAVAAQPTGTAVTPDPYGSGAAPPVASTPSDTGAPWMAFEFGARLAFGLPFGQGAGGNGNDLDHSFSNLVAPLWLDAGFRFASHWYVGGYFSYGITSIASQLSNTAQCNLAGVGCSGNDIRLGVNAQYHVLPDGAFDPWFGLGFGYEWASFTQTVEAAESATGKAASYNIGDSGWEFVNIQAGLDFRLLNGALGVGPFVSLAITEYVSQSLPDANGDGGTTGSSINNQAFHEWLLFGARGDFDLKLH